MDNVPVSKDSVDANVISASLTSGVTRTFTVMLAIVTLTAPLHTNVTVRLVSVSVTLESVATSVTSALVDIWERLPTANRAANASTTGT